jgi:hypothetical protein
VLGEHRQQYQGGLHSSVNVSISGCHGTRLGSLLWFAGGTAVVPTVTFLRWPWRLPEGAKPTNAAKYCPAIDRRGRRKLRA